MLSARRLTPEGKATSPHEQVLERKDRNDTLAVGFRVNSKPNSKACGSKFCEQNLALKHSSLK